MKALSARLTARWLGDDWDARSPLRFAVGYLREFRWRAAGVVFLSCLTALFEGGSLAMIMLGVQVLLSQSVSDSFRTLGRMGSLAAPLIQGRTVIGAFVILVVAGVLAQLLRSTTSYVTSVAGIYLQNRIARTAIVRGYERILSVDFAYLMQQKGGEVSYKATTMPMLAAVIQQMINMIQALTMLVAYTLLLLIIAPWFALAVVIGAVGLSWVMTFVHRSVRHHAEAHARLQPEVSHFGMELFQAFRLIHTHAAWRQTAAEIKRLIDASYLTRRRFEVIAASVAPLFEMMLITSIATLLLAIIYFNGASAPQVLSRTLVSILIVYRAMPWANTLNSVRSTLAQNLPQLAYSAALFNDKRLPIRPSNLPPLDEPVTTIAFERVSYWYPGSEGAAVAEVSFALPAGRCVALVGASGSGKSTLTDLFVGLREPTSGVIQINGRDLKTVDSGSWRARLGVVSQDTFLFNMSLRANIAYGFEVDETRLRHAARLAHVEEFLVDLPQGFDTVVGDRGYRLSGGQRQRVALARALYRQPEILILDEATSALDSASERVVQAAIEESIGSGITTIMVAHRLSTIAHADEILVLDRGRIVQRGTHASLLGAGGVYAHLWSIQSLTEATA